MPLDGISVAARVMADDMFRLNVVSQNLANANTAAYKRELPVARPFTDYLQAGGLSIPVSLPALASMPDMRQGTLTRTGNALELALEGEGMFEAAGPDGPVYLRQGSFRLNGSGILVTPAGLPVSGTGGEIALSTPTPRIDEQGRIYEGERQVAQLKILRFPPSALTPLGGGLYRSAARGEVPTEGVTLRQGFVESSNVQSLTEMLRIVETVRRFESAQRLLQGYDGMLGGAIRTLGEF